MKEEVKENINKRGSKEELKYIYIHSFRVNIVSPPCLIEKKWEREREREREREKS